MGFSINRHFKNFSYKNCSPNSNNDFSKIDSKFVKLQEPVHYVGRLYYWLTKRGRHKFWEQKLWGSLGNFTQIFRICPKMFQFLKYLLHKQIIEMCHSQNLRRPLLVPCPTQCFCKIFKCQKFFCITVIGIIQKWMFCKINRKRFVSSERNIWENWEKI